MDAVTRQRLIQIGAEKLADTLLDLTARSDEAADLVERLIGIDPAESAVLVLSSRHSLSEKAG